MKNYKLLSVLCVSGLLSACGGGSSSSPSTTNTLQKGAIDSFSSIVSAQAFNKIDYPEGRENILFVDGDAPLNDSKVSTISKDMIITGSSLLSELQIDKDSTITINSDAQLLTGVLKVTANNVTIDAKGSKSFAAQIVDITWKNPGGVFAFASDNFAITNFDTRPHYITTGERAIIKTTGDGRFAAGGLSFDKNDYLLVNKGTLEMESLNSSGTVSLMDKDAHIKFDALFKQRPSGNLVIIEKSDTTPRLSASNTHLAGTLKTLGGVSGTIISTSTHQQGIFDIVDLESGAVYYEKNSVVIKTNTFAPIEEWRTKIKLEKTKMLGKYDDGDFKASLMDSNEAELVQANRVDLSSQGDKVFDVSKLEKVGRLRLTSHTANTMTIKNKDSLQIQVLDIISNNTSIFNFAHAPKFIKTLAPTVGFEDAASAPTMITNTGSTTWQVGGVNGDITLEDGMHFAHKGGKFICNNLMNTSGVIILDGAKANLEVENFTQGEKGKLVILHDGDFSDSLINTAKALTGGTLEVVSNKAGGTFPLITAQDDGSFPFSKIIGATTKLTPGVGFNTLTYSPTGTPSPFLQKTTNPLLSALSHNAPVAEFKLAPEFMLAAFATPDVKNNSKALPTCGASLKFKGIDLFASNIVLDDQPQATSVTSVGFGTHHTLDNLTLSCKFTQHTQDFKSMKFGSIDANAHAHQNVASFGGKLNVSNAYVSFDYHHLVFASKLHAQFQTFSGVKNMAFDAQASGMVYMKAGVRKDDLNLQASLIHAANGATKYAFEVTFKQ